MYVYAQTRRHHNYLASNYFTRTNQSGSAASTTPYLKFDRPHNRTSGFQHGGRVSGAFIYLERCCVSGVWAIVCWVQPSCCAQSFGRPHTRCCFRPSHHELVSPCCGYDAIDSEITNRNFCIYLFKTFTTIVALQEEPNAPQWSTY